MGAVLKGRPSSPRLNDELVAALPTYLGAGLLVGDLWINTHDNVADDPLVIVPYDRRLTVNLVGCVTLAKEIF